MFCFVSAGWRMEHDHFLQGQGWSLPGQLSSFKTKSEESDRCLVHTELKVCLRTPILKSTISSTRPTVGLKASGLRGGHPLGSPWAWHRSTTPMVLQMLPPDRFGAHELVDLPQKAPISTAWRKSERPARKSFTKGDRAQSLKTKQKEADPSRKCSPLDRLPHNIDSPRDRFNWSTSYRNPGRPAQPFDRSQLGLFHFFTQRPR